jgi:hypothetical protein
MVIQNDDAQERLLKLQLRLAQLEMKDASQTNFLTFVKHVWPEFIAGEHHRIIAEKLERVASGDLKRLIINMAPRHTKSEFASFLFPAWFMGRFPNKKIIQATHTTELAVGFGRKTKNLIERDDYKDIFDVQLAADSKASGRWDTDRGGMYYAVGVGSNLAGRGGDLIIIDDPHSEQTLMSNTGFDDAWDWYTGGPRQRLQPGGAIVVVMTRWHEKDLTGQLIRAQARDPRRPISGKLWSCRRLCRVGSLVGLSIGHWTIWSVFGRLFLRASGMRSISRIRRVMRTRFCGVIGGGFGRRSGCLLWIM